MLTKLDENDFDAIAYFIKQNLRFETKTTSTYTGNYPLYVDCTTVKVYFQDEQIASFDTSS